MVSLPKFVLAAVGHNEQEYLAGSLEMLFEAAGPGDDVWFVDSASTDDSAKLAAGMGATVVDAPIGKGRAVATAMKVCEADHICLIDADIVSSEFNIAALLRHAALDRPADMIIGQFWQEGLAFMPSTTAIFAPLTQALFPEVGDRYGTKTLTGFRVFSKWDFEELPPTFGLEAFFNIEAAVNRWSTRVVDIGRYEGRFLRKPLMPYEIAETILDLAEKHDRLSRAERSRWEDWVEQVAGKLKDHEGLQSQSLEMRRHVMKALSLPRPSDEDYV